MKDLHYATIVDVVIAMHEEVAEPGGIAQLTYDLIGQKLCLSEDSENVDVIGGSA